MAEDLETFSYMNKIEYGEDESEDHGGFHSLKLLPEDFEIGAESDLWVGGEGGYVGSLVRKSSKTSEENKQIALKDEWVAKYKLILTERQELRRKNLFLQKKMVEFFKRRKMDHALKEDPKGLDLESKYIKRLFQLQEYKRFVVSADQAMLLDIEMLMNDTSALKEVLMTTFEEFISRQKKFACSLELKKNKKKISKTAIGSFLSQQSADFEILCGLRVKEIKMKKLLSDKRELVSERDTLGHGVSRADFEQVRYEKQTASRNFELKVEETTKFQEKVRKVVHSLAFNKQKEEGLLSELQSWEERLEEAKTTFIQTRYRIQRITKIRNQLRSDGERLDIKSGLLTRDNLLRDFESSLQQATEIWRQLEQEEVEFKSRVARSRGGQVNTPTDFFAIPPADDDELEFPDWTVFDDEV